MGANLLIATLSIPATIELAAATLAAAVDTATDDTLDLIGERMIEFDLVQFDACGDEDEDEGERELFRQEVRAHLRGAITELRHDNHELICYDIGPGCELLAGGMSWGDPPSDTFTALTILAEASDLLRQNLPYCLSDYRTHLLGRGPGPDDFEDVAAEGHGRDFAICGTRGTMQVSRAEAEYILHTLGLDPNFLDDEPGTDVVQLDPADPRATVCGTCGRGWDDSVSTAMTPVPAGRCPFEHLHDDKGDNKEKP